MAKSVSVKVAAVETTCSSGLAEVGVAVSGVMFPNKASARGVGEGVGSAARAVAVEAAWTDDGVEVAVGGDAVAVGWITVVEVDVGEGVGSAARAVAVEAAWTDDGVEVAIGGDAVAVGWITVVDVGEEVGSAARTVAVSWSTAVEVDVGEEVGSAARAVAVEAAGMGDMVEAGEGVAVSWATAVGVLLAGVSLNKPAVSEATAITISNPLIIKRRVLRRRYSSCSHS